MDTPAESYVPARLCVQVRPAPFRGALRVLVRHLRCLLAVHAGILPAARPRPRAAWRALRRRHGHPAHLGATVRAPRGSHEGAERFLMMALLCAVAMVVALATRGGSSQGRWRGDPAGD